jgi:hypothetical protein
MLQLEEQHRHRPASGLCDHRLGWEFKFLQAEDEIKFKLQVVGIEWKLMDGVGVGVGDEGEGKGTKSESEVDEDEEE